MKIDDVGKNLNPLDFWGCLGWKEIADGSEWINTYKDHHYYILITANYGTPIKARFDDDFGGVFICLVEHPEVAETAYYNWDSGILYVAEMPSTAEVIESIEAICDKVESEVIKWTPQRNVTDLGNQ